MITHVGYSVVGRSGGQVTPCAVCTVHVEMRSANFLVEPQNKGQWFNLKTTVTVFSILISKLAVVSPGLTSKSMAWVFLACDSKPAATVW
jgi:hypothetical protein